MSCTKPLVRIETWETYTNQKGGKSYKADIVSGHGFTTEGIKAMRSSPNYRNITLIPCGNCVGCKLDYARDKAVQLSLELKNPKYGKNECWFLTLTYDDLHLKTHKTVDTESGETYEGVSIEESDMQNFWKRLRYYMEKKYPGKKIQYLNCCEYGGITSRPHAHAIVFGLPLDPGKFERHGNNSQGDAYFISNEKWAGGKKDDKLTLSEIWGQGEVIIGEATFQSMSYVARYTLKKAKAQYNDWWYQSQGKKKEWVSMSQSIGRWYYDEHKEEIYDMDCVPVLDNHGNLQKPPKSYDRFYAKEEPEKWKKVQERRQKQAESQMLQVVKQSDKKEWEIREVKEELLKQFKDLRREV